MKNFFRAVRLALRYRLIFGASVICSLVVGAMWGANIGALYPVIEVVFREKSLGGYLDEEIAERKEVIAQLDDDVRLMELQLLAAGDEQQRTIERDLRRKSDRRKTEAYFRDLAIWLQPNVHQYLPADAFNTLIVIVGFLLAGTAIKNVFLGANIVLVQQLTELAMFRLRKQFFRRTLRLDLGSFNDRHSAELISRFTNDMGRLAGGLNSLLGNSIREPFKLLACIIGASLVCWRLLLLSMVIVPLAVLLIRLVAKSIKRANRRAMEEMQKIYGMLDDTFGGIKAVKAFTMERVERRRFHQVSKQYMRRVVRISTYIALAKPVGELMGIGIFCLSLLVGAYLALSGETHIGWLKISEMPLSIGVLTLFYGFLIGMNDPMNKLANVYSEIQAAGAAADRVYDMLDRRTKLQTNKERTALPPRIQRLTFRDVNFQYTNDVPVLHGVNLDIRFGETIAIVGPNGCGKSTLLNLIPRFYDPTEGQVLVDDIDVRKVSLRELRQRIGLVTQETVLFHGTILDNIRYGAPHAPDSDVIEAARQAHAHGFITDDLEEGYQTPVGQRGVRLSGGQRQRIALARAILRDPQILLLDEATSQVDLESEQLVHRVLEQFAQHRTTILITHRVATLDLADRIVVMEEGRIADVGTHAELMARCELFQRLHHIQFRTSA